MAKRRVSESQRDLRDPIPERTIPGRYRAIVYALLLHVAVIAVLVIGFNWTSTPVATPPAVIQATVTEDPERRKQEAERRQEEENTRRQEEERKKAEAERKRQEAVEAKKREEARLVEEKRKQAEAEQQRQAELKKRKEEERKKAEAEAERKRKEAEAKKKREEDEARRKAAEESLKQQLEEEERGRAEQAKADRAARELNKYEAAIRKKVGDNWNRPPNIAPGLQCLVRVRLGPGGVVLEATVEKGSGNAIFDRSVPPAVHNASPLPIPPDAELFEYYREIRFVFKPQ